MGNSHAPRSDNGGRGSIDRASLRYKQTVTLAIISLLLILLFILLLVIIIISINTENTSPSNGENDKISIDYRDIEYTSMTVLYSDTQKGSLVLVNSSHEYTFPEKDNWQNIIQYRNEQSSQKSAYQLSNISLKLDSEAGTAMHKMLTKFYIESGKDSIIVTSAYRTYDEQLALNSSIKAGFSDSHTGLSFSLAVYENSITSQINSADNKSIYYDWLASHAHEYGIILRYPEDKVQKTGVANYVNSFRYVGVAHATYMYNNNLCLEEYIDFLKANTSFKNPLEVRGADGKSYIIYYYFCDGDSIEINVPVTVANPNGSVSHPYTVSGTNDSGIVVTVCLG